jgi:NAD(P)-dependent dehydrogenase (short-subunit alcohol dehydrogenase family)
MNARSRLTGLTGVTAVVTGGTDGIGAATALELRARGADVTIVGRSPAKAQALVARADALPGSGSLRAITADLSLMRTAREIGERLAEEIGHVDLLLNAVGILITRTAHTDEGIELDFAVGYLSRFVLMETLAARGAFTPTTRIVSIAASSREVPKFARLEFDDLAAVEARTGMTSHGLAQLANDLLIAQAAARYGVTAVGYGPGAVDTSIRRDVPPLIRTLLKPFYARSTRPPEEVGRQIADIFADPSVKPGDTAFFNRGGRFPTASFIADAARQAALLRTSLALSEKALASR